MRRLLLALAVGILVWAVLVVPLPLAVLAPVAARPVAQVVEVDGSVDGSDGSALPEDLLFTAVAIQQPSAAGAVEVLLDERRDLTLLGAVVPPGIDRDRFERRQQRLFEESVRAAAAVGLRAAGRDVQVSGDGARVVATVPATPADRQLEQEDVIVEVDGEEVTLASELAALLSGREVGDEVELTVRRDGEQVSETLRLTALSQTGQAGLGVLVATVDLEIDLPVDVMPTPEARIGGPSAGLMIALTLYDLASDGDLGGGRAIAGTGTMDLSGRVGTVSGVDEKVRGAAQAGAEVFLVPPSGEQAARDAAPDGLEVIVVESLQDAIDALSG